MHLRETLEELNELETAFNKSAIAQFTTPVYSYVSVVELSNYMAKQVRTLRKILKSSPASSRFCQKRPISAFIR